ncbi:exodeoxyribonuclease V subunit alpha [Solidesulfovibrio carbinolicus]|uniref:Exodeoxyribonuclease V subunit alpha n=1 Tax=Solidesulfovibrio carbinolicus TaxID=296842 RepID=A0A4P6HK50_9BACT|nr:exodeoxyribonuclease V subunit alpha [Solidesulfovibrio carbinolicus]QAZ67275.1 exodeoxyribonuclease V subunit alpha [Solidesulfovibrio carbinolicus]
MLRTESPAVTKLREMPMFEPMDLHFANCLCHLGDCHADDLALAAALTSRGTGLGHICIDLSLPLETIFPEISFPLPDATRLLSALSGLPCLGGPEDFTPLVLDGTRLYLRRYHQYERDLAEGLLKLATKPAATDEHAAREALRRLFPDGASELDMQMASTFSACRSHLAVITGGPGTGKTFTAARIVAMLQDLEGIPGHRIALAAPTGKAAARLYESLRQAFAIPALTARANDLPTEATTLHRLLGLRPNSPKTRHDRDNPLPYSLVFVDEASMASLPVMAKLVRALPNEARLILLGDRDQLASVEAGAALADICGDGWVTGFSGKFRESLARVFPKAQDLPSAPEPTPPLADAVVHLNRTWRFDDTSGIAAVSRAVRTGDADATLAVLAEPHIDLTWVQPKTNEEVWTALEPLIHGYTAALNAHSPDEAFRAWGSLRLLTPLRQGAYGVEGLNRHIDGLLRERGAIVRSGFWHPGKPVLITRNDPSLGLFNGDMGVALEDETGSLRVWFPGTHGGWRHFSPTRLTAVEEVYAMTVHKSQGSEFDVVYFLLPDRESPVLTRELLYTAITRAKKQAMVIGGSKLIRDCVTKVISRHSNLRNLLVAQDWTHSDANGKGDQAVKGN